MACHMSVSFEEARFCIKILDILWDEGLIRGYKIIDNGLTQIFLLYSGGYSQIQRLSIYLSIYIYEYITAL
ncbi:unnamed protein product, partial [Sphacelaria rigidula]